MGSPINNSPAEITRQILIDQGFGVTPATPPTVPADWSAYVDSEPNIPDNCITVFDGVNQSDGRSMVDGELWTHYGVQIRVRGKDFSTAYVKAYAIKRQLAALMPSISVTVGQNSYVVHCFSKIHLSRLGKDTPRSKRSLMVINCNLAFS